MFVDWSAPRLPLVDGRLVAWLAFGLVGATLALGSTATDRGRVVARYSLLAGLVVVAVVLGWDTFSVWSRLGVGWPYAVLVVYAAGAAVLWLVARWIDEYGAGQGALVLLLAQTVLAGAGDLASSRISTEPVSSVLDVVVVGLPSIVLCAALAFRAPAAWPVKVAGGLTLTSPLDALGLQVVALALLSPAALAAIPALPAWLVVPLRLSVGIAGFAIVWSALGRATLARRRSIGWLALAIGLLAAEIAWPVLAASRLAPVARSVPVGRLDVALGSTDVILSARGGDAAADSAIVASRLERLGLHAEVTDASNGRMHLVVDYAPDLRSVLDVVASRGALALRPAAASETPPAAARRLGAGDVLSARSSSSIDEAGVVIELTSGAAARIRELVGSGTDGSLVLLVDDRPVATSPAQAARATGTALRVNLGSPRRDPDVVRRADALAATLSTAALSKRWTVQTFRMNVRDPR